MPPRDADAGLATPLALSVPAPAGIIRRRIQPEASIPVDTLQPVSQAPAGDAEPLPAERQRRLRPPRGYRVLPFRILAVRLGFTLGRFLPLRRRVVFAVSHSFELTGNLAFIRNELDRRDPPIPYRILAHRTVRTWKSWLGTFVRQAQAGFYIATSRVFIVDDYFFPLYVIKPREGTTVVQTWHASGAFKKIGWSVLDKSFGADEEFVNVVAIHSNYDVCLMASSKAAAYYADAFRQPLEKFRMDLGMPRTDVLFGDEKVARIKAEVRAKYALPEGKKVILYAPTFRGENVRRARTPENLDLRAMRGGARPRTTCCCSASTPSFERRRRSRTTSARSRSTSPTTPTSTS